MDDVQIFADWTNDLHGEEMERSGPAFLPAEIRLITLARIIIAGMNNKSEMEKRKAASLPVLFCILCPHRVPHARDADSHENPIVLSS
jgi:hypothetical protein